MQGSKDVKTSTTDEAERVAQRAAIVLLKELTNNFSEPEPIVAPDGRVWGYVIPATHDGDPGIALDELDVRPTENRDPSGSGISAVPAS